MEGGVLLDVVVGQGTADLELLSTIVESYLIRGNSLLVLDFSFHVVDCFVRQNIKGEGLACESLNEDLHRSAAQIEKLFVGCTHSRDLRV